MFSQGKSFLFFLFIAVSFSFYTVPVFSQDLPLPNFGPTEEEKKEEELKKKGVVTLQDLPADQPVAEFVEGKPQSKRRHIYEKPTMKSLANLYWALGFTDLDNDDHIDSYLKLTECKIFKRFIASEFEWREIRDATRKFISANRTEFPMRFELVQEIKLLDYDVKRRAFEIAPKYQVQSYRRFEMVATGVTYESLCGHKKREIHGFPRGVILELSRPFSLTYVPASPSIAEEYLEEKARMFQAMSENAKNQYHLYNIRTAYLVMQVKVFAHRKTQKLSSGYLGLQTMAVLEGYEVYGDIGRKQLFFSKSYLTDRTKLEVSEKLKKEIMIIEERVAGNGILVD